MENFIEAHTNDSLGHYMHELSFAFFDISSSEKRIRAFLGIARGFGCHDIGTCVLVS